MDAERDILVTIAKAETECHVCADAHRLKQALLNLLANAIKYNREEGEMRIVFTRSPGQSKKRWLRS